MPASQNSPSAGTPRVLGALALELTGLSPVGRDALARTEVETLAGLVARDLAKLAPDAASLELVTVGAHYDPIELLRPSWPLHAELDQLAARAPRSGIAPDEGRVIAFGSHEGKLPGALSPSSEHAGGPLRLVPFVLSGPEQATARVSATFEADLLETGMAGADTALAAQDAFGLQVEHARYMTVHDLLAMTAMQYDHAGLGPLWPVVETALLAPAEQVWVDELPEPLLHYSGGEVRIAMLDPAAWYDRYGEGADHRDEQERERLERMHRHFEARQRQFGTVLAAHGIPVTFVHCMRGEDCHAALG